MGASPRLCGIDGCPGGWVMVERAGDALSARFVPSGQLELAAFDAAGIDIPIGLAERGRRECDAAARRFLGEPRARSVFDAPIRRALDAATWEEACEITCGVNGHRVSRQAFNIYAKVAEIDRLLRRELHLVERVFEVHPECSFAAWNGGLPMRHNKKTEAGRRERTRLIERHFGHGSLAAARAAVRGHGIAADDVADAFAVLWSVERIAVGTAVRLPAEMRRDACGLPMQIHW